MRTVYLGTSRFAASVLERLAAGDREGPCTHCEAAAVRTGRHRPTLVITRPDRPAGRGRRLQSPPVADAARALGIELAQPAAVNDTEARALIARARPDAVIVCAFGALIKEPLLSAHEMLNVHPSLLPRWRGAAPIERAIMAGDPRTGVSIMRLTSGLDSGPVCATAAEAIESRDTYGSLAPRLERLGAELLNQTLDAIEAGSPPRFAEQDERQATYAEKIAAPDRLLDPTRSALELERVVRALDPHIGARLQQPDGTLVGVIRARALPASVAPGTLAALEGRLLYGTREGALELLELRPPGGRPMEAGAYMRGHAL